MCCLLTILLLIGPRAAAIVWWLLDTARWQTTFADINVIVPVLGLLFLPWTLLAYVFFAPGGIEGLEWAVLVVAFLVDIGSTSGSAYRNRERIR